MNFPEQDAGELRAQAIAQWRERLGTAHRKAMDAQAARIRLTYTGDPDEFKHASEVDLAAMDEWLRVHFKVFAEIEQALAEVPVIHDREAA